MESCVGLASQDCFDQPQNVPAARCGICSLHPAQLGLLTGKVIQRAWKHHKVVKSNKDIKFASKMQETMRASRSRGSSSFVARQAAAREFSQPRSLCVASGRAWHTAHNSQSSRECAERQRQAEERGEEVVVSLRLEHSQEMQKFETKPCLRKGTLASVTLRRAAVARPDSTLDQNRSRLASSRSRISSIFCLLASATPPLIFAAVDPARTTSEATCPPCRRQNDVEETTPFLQDLLWDGMRVRLDGGPFVEIISDLCDSSTRCFFTRERSRIDPVGPAARYMSPDPVLLFARSHKF